MVTAVRLQSLTLTALDSAIIRPDNPISSRAGQAGATMAPGSALGALMICSEQDCAAIGPKYNCCAKSMACLPCHRSAFRFGTSVALPTDNGGVPVGAREVTVYELILPFVRSMLIACAGAVESMNWKLFCVLR